MRHSLLCLAVLASACEATPAPVQTLRITLQDVQSIQAPLTEAVADDVLLPLEKTAFANWQKVAAPASSIRSVTPVYRVDVSGPAYHILSLAPRGYLMLSLAAHDYPVREYSVDADHPALALGGAKLYHFGGDIYASEDAQGAFVASTQPLRFFDLGEDTHEPFAFAWEPGDDASAGTLTVNGQTIDVLPSDSIEDFLVASTDVLSTEEPGNPEDWETVKATWHPGFAETQREEQAARVWESFLDVLVMPHTDPTVGVPQDGQPLPRGMSILDEHILKRKSPWYSQVGPLEDGNTRTCSSGCGPTAMAMLFGWADAMAEESPKWSRSNARKILPDAAPATVNSALFELRDLMGTFCVGDQAATMPWDLGKAVDFLRKRRVRIAFESNYGFTPLFAAKFNGDVWNLVAKEMLPAMIGGPSGKGPHYFIVEGVRRRTSDASLFGLAVPWKDSSVDYLVNNGWGSDQDSHRWQHSDGTYALTSVHPGSAQ